MVDGVVAAPGSSKIEVMSGAESTGSLTFSRVLAPADGWVVARSVVSPGAVLGSVWVRKGENRDVALKLNAAEGAQVRVALHVDRGKGRVFEFDPKDARRDPDGPVFVNRSPIESVTSLGGYGAEVAPNSALMMVDDEQALGRRIRLRYLLTPEPSWVSVNLVEDGLPGAELARVLRPAGESQEIDLVLDRHAPLGSEVVVTLHADRGELGRFEYDASDPLGSRDQPLKSSGVVVSKRVQIR